MSKIPIIHSKIIPPIPPTTYMVRANLIKKLQEMEHYKITLVQSEAGFGKSLGLAQYFKETNQLYSWYSVTEEDDDIIPFLSYLKQSIKRVVPAFGDSMENIALHPNSFLKDEELRQWFTLFINELCTIEEDLFIIIDDYYLVDHVFMINDFLEKMIKLIPPNIHVVIASRSKLTWSILPKLKVMNELFEITKQDFIFSAEEMMIYLEDYFDLTVEKYVVDELIELTEGWAIAIHLIAIHFDQIDTSFTSENKMVFNDLFAYLSEEVFQRQSAKEQAALLKYVIFPTFSKEVIADFYDDETANLLSDTLAELGFIQSLEEENTYRYHALFQQFLQNKWLQTNPEAYVDLHQQAAIYFISNKDYLQATYHAAQTGDASFIGSMLAQTGKYLVESGQFDRYLDVFQQVDVDVLERYYSLYFFKGEVERYRAFYEKAQKAYQTCKALAEKHNDYYFLSKANASIAHIFLDTIQPNLADPYLKEAITLSQKALDMSDIENRMLKRQFAENLVNLGKANEARRWMEDEKIEREILENGNLDARTLLRMGKLHQGVDLLVNRLTKEGLPDSHRETEVLLSFMYGMLGDKELALSYAEEGIKTAEKAKSLFTEAVGYTRAGHAKLLLSPFDIDVTEKLYVKAIHMMDELRVDRGKVEPLMGLAMLKVRQGDRKQALALGEQALAETEKVSDQWMSSLIYICLAITNYYEVQFEQAEQAMIKAQHLLRICGDLYGEMITYYWLMHLYHKVGDTEKLKEVSLRFATICVEEQYLFFVKKDTLFGPIDRQINYSLFQEVASLHPDDKHIQLLVHELKIDGQLDYPGYSLYVRALGRIQVMLGTYSIDEKAWKREKAKELFLYFLLQRERFIDKDEIMQALWPDQEEKTANQSLKVTLNALLKVIEPKRKARKESFFIQRKSTMYRLNPLAEIIFDMDYFYNDVAAGLAEADLKKSNAILERAIHLYQGNPFETLKGSHWFAQEEVELESQYIQALERLAYNYLQLQQFQEVIAWSRQILQVNQTWETAYRFLMTAYYHLKNRPESIKWYNHCVTTLEKELGIRPMEETTAVYEMILKNEIELM